MSLKKLRGSMILLIVLVIALSATPNYAGTPNKDSRRVIIGFDIDTIKYLDER